MLRQLEIDRLIARQNLRVEARAVVRRLKADRWRLCAGPVRDEYDRTIARFQKLVKKYR